jgi:hypothetical protein
MYTPTQLRMLKIAVIGMGVILLVGFLVVIGRIIYLVNSGPRPPSGLAAALTSPAVTPPPLALPKGAIVRHLAVSGHLIVLHYESPAGAGIRVIDVATGNPAISIPIIEPPAAQSR